MNLASAGVKRLSTTLTKLTKRHPPVGARPGTLVLPETTLPPRIRMMRFGAGEVEERAIEDIETLPEQVREGRVVWIDIQGLGDEPLLRRLAELFSIHPLSLEDVVNAPQRPKFDQHDAHLMLIARMVRMKGTYDLDAEQISLFLSPGLVLTFQEHYGDVLDPVRQRIRDAFGPIHKEGADYLAYAILDTVVDAYYPALENLSETLERLELAVFENPTTRILDRLNRVKAILGRLRRGIWPQRDVVASLLREESTFISKGVGVYLRDTHDHCAQLVDVTENLRDLVTNLMNTYMSVVGQRTNEVMKVLTIISSIFIPLTFIAGIYGMNFDTMPELRRPWGYPATLGTMLVIAVSLLIMFRRRGWLGSPKSHDDPRDDL